MSSVVEPEALRRVRALVEGARLIADPETDFGRRARRELVLATGLSQEGVELALAECLETQPSDSELETLCAGVEPVRAAHVLLSANVFVGAHRAVALALAASARVFVRPSRREPAFARLLAAAAPSLFEIVSELAPESGDAVWVYGADETLHTVRGTLAPGVAYHAHGFGLGVAVVDASNASLEAARALALDVAPFDQRGCLSPRAVVFSGSDDDARAFATLVADALARLAERVPLGALGPDEAADVTRFRDAMAYADSALPAGPGWVGVAARDVLVVAPVGRNLAIIPCHVPEKLLEPSASTLAALGLAARPELEGRLRQTFPDARSSALGRMQRPPFDGPVDRRKP